LDRGAAPRISTIFLFMNTTTLFQKGHTPWNSGTKTGNQYWIGKPKSEVTKEKIRQSLRKGEYKHCEICNKQFWTRPSNTKKRFCSVECMGISNRGRVISEEQKKLLSLAKIGSKNPMYGKVGELHHRWKADKTEDERTKIRFSKEYRQWRTAVFERDNYTCQNCEAKSGNGIAVYLEAHHIKSWKNYKNLRYILENGQTLCRACHNLTKRGVATV
jgi:hypothetical protein